MTSFSEWANICQQLFHLTTRQLNESSRSIWDWLTISIFATKIEIFSSFSNLSFDVSTTVVVGSMNKLMKREFVSLKKNQRIYTPFVCRRKKQNNYLKMLIKELIRVLSTWSMYTYGKCISSKKKSKPTKSAVFFCRI